MDDDSRIQSADDAVAEIRRLNDALPDSDPRKLRAEWAVKLRGIDESIFGPAEEAANSQKWPPKNLPSLAEVQNIRALLASVASAMESYASPVKQ